MAVNWKQVVGPAQLGDVEAEQRKLELAQALQARALKGTAPGAGGRITPKYSTTNALVDFAGQLAANRRVDRQEGRVKQAQDAKSKVLNDAISRYMQSVADDQVPQAAVQELRRTPDGQLMNPVVSRSEAMAGLAGASGLGAQQALAAELMKGEAKNFDPEIQQNAALRAYQIEGTLEERRLAREQRLQEIEMRLADARTAAADRAALQREQMQLRADLQREMERGRNERSAADREARGDATREKEQDKKDGRIAALEATNAALARLETSSANLGKGGGAIEGRMPALGTLTQDYDGAVSQLLAAIQSALRVPGIGSQSNMELQALMGALPLRTQNQEVRTNQINGIRNRLRIIMERELGMALPDAGTAGGGGTAPPAAPVTKVINGKTYEQVNGQWFEKGAP